MTVTFTTPSPHLGRDRRAPPYERQVSLPQYDNHRPLHFAAADPVPYSRQHSSPYERQQQQQQQLSTGGRYAAPPPRDEELYNPAAFSAYAQQYPPSSLPVAGGGVSSRQSVSSLASFSSSGMVQGRYDQIIYACEAESDTLNSPGFGH